MSIWKWAGLVGGGVIGFLAGGPAGAVAGAGLGYQAGASEDESNAEDAAKAENAAASAAAQPNKNAWNPTPGNLGNATGESDEQLRLKDEIQRIDDELERLRIASRDSNDFNEIAQIQYQIRTLTTAKENDKTALIREGQKQGAVTQEQRDALFAAGKMREAEGRAAPTISPTTIQTTKADLGAANNTLAGSEFIRDRQLSQADKLQSGVGGAEQADLAARLKANSGGEGQAAHIARLESDLAGNQPSLAQLQLEEGRDASINNAMSIANSARGNTMGMSQIEALRSNQAAMQQARREAAMLRASEYATARGELGTTLGQKRAQDQAGWSLEGTTLSQKRGQDLQGENLAATEYGQARGQDLSTAGIQSQNALSQAQMDAATRLAQANMDDSTKRANLAAYFQQQGMNEQMAMYWADKYTHFKERPEDLKIDAEKTRSGAASDAAARAQTQSNADADRQRQRDAAITQGIATAGGAYISSMKSGGVTPTSTPGGRTSGVYADNPYKTDDKDPWTFGRTG